MKKYKYSRKEWVLEFTKWLGFDDKFAEFDEDVKDERKWLKHLLATKEPKETAGEGYKRHTKPESDKENKYPVYTKKCLDVWGPSKEELEVEEPMSFLEKVVRQLEERVVGINNRVLKLEETKSKKTNG